MTHKNIIVKDYFIEVIDESRSTVDYKPVQHNVKELVSKIYTQNSYIDAMEKKLKAIQDIITNYNLNEETGCYNCMYYEDMDPEVNCEDDCILWHFHRIEDIMKKEELNGN